jgi:hypothetical protein
MLNKIDSMFIAAKSKVEGFLTKKHGGFDGLIIAIGLILVALIVVLAFKGKVQPTMEGAIDATNKGLSNVVNELSSTTH